MRKLFFALVFTLPLFQSGFAQWEWQYPLPQGNTLNDMTFLEADRMGYAVGNYGSFISSDDMGASWSLIDTLTTKHLRAVDFIRDDLGFVAGDSGLIMKYNGNSWVQMETNSYYQIRDIDFTSESHGVAVGYKGLILKLNANAWDEVVSGTTKTLYGVSFGSDQKGLIVGDEGLIMRTTDGGTSWSMVNSSTQVPLYGVAMPTENIGFAVGKGGIILKTADGGATWNNISLSVIEDDLFGIYFRDDQTGAVCGENGNVLRTSNAGSNWKFEGLYASVTLYDVYPFQWDADTVDCDTLMVCGTNGSLINIFTGACDTLDYQYVAGTSMTLNSLAFNSNSGFAVGGDPFLSKPLILKTSNGQAWTPYVVDTIRQYISDISLVSDSLGYMCGYNGRIWRTRDGGDSWNPLITGVSQRLTAITAAFANDTLVKGWAVGFNGTLLQSTLDDTIWQKIDLNMNQHLYGLDFYAPWKGFVVGEFGTLLKVSSNINNNLLITPINTGVTAALYDIAYPNDSTAFIVGFGGKIFKYFFNSKDKALIPVASGVTNPLNRIFFTDPDTGYIAGEGGLVLKTTDGGIKWLPLNTRTSSGLRGIWFTDGGTGYVVGAGGSILYTDNGGGHVVLPGVKEKEEAENLIRIYPNPNSGNFDLSFRMTVAGHVMAVLYDLSGNPVETLIDDKLPAGEHQRRIRAMNLHRGVYVMVVRIGQNSYTGKVVVID